jgi:hypothetical protein
MKLFSDFPKKRGLWLLAVCLLLSQNVNHVSASVASAGSAAAMENARLMNELTWFFGGRSQRGWFLYLPLISQMIGTESSAGSSEFALALAGWQRTVGLEPHGVLDHETWLRMVEIFQARRIRQRSTPATDRLVEAPATDFYDPQRPAELRQVEREAYAAWQRMIAAAQADPALKLSSRELKIISAFRSPAYQAQLRARNPQSGRAGLAVNSPHFTGRALDLYVGGEPVSTNDVNRAQQIRTPVYRWLVKNAARFGFQPYFYEPWHWEYTALVK